MHDWSPIGSARTNGTWIKVRGWDFGLEGARRHYVSARFDNGKWIEAHGNQLRYLTDWQELSRSERSGHSGPWPRFLENRT
jgi:hypothetical protein